LAATTSTARSIRQDAPMPFTADAAKPALLDETTAIQKKQALWVLLVALTSPVAVSGIPIIVGPAALCIYVLQRNKLDIDRIPQ
jgi:hypothetical protein